MAVHTSANASEIALSVEIRPNKPNLQLASGSEQSLDLADLLLLLTLGGNGCGDEQDDTSGHPSKHHLNLRLAQEIGDLPTSIICEVLRIGAKREFVQRLGQLVAGALNVTLDSVDTPCHGHTP